MRGHMVNDKFSIVNPKGKETKLQLRGQQFRKLGTLLSTF